jgi:tRNA nucleotidyltransferase (CCA-adding enzyme)
VLKLNLKKVLTKIKPSARDLAQEKAMVKKLLNKIKQIEGKHVDVVLAGSLSRNTHLKGDRDLDIFLLFEKKLNRQEFEKEGLRIGKAVFRGHFWEKAFSEHPYIRGNIEGFDIEIVPSYKISNTRELLSAVDRTPFHTRFLEQNLKVAQKDEVRLLKQFLKGIKCYGADLKASSFSGYLVELLILHYGSFSAALKAVADWQRGQVIDLKKYYSENDAKKKFKEPLIVVDPTDKNRNVAAALSYNQMARFISAARAFMEKPSEKYFFRRKTKPWTVKKVRSMLKKKELIGVQLAYPKSSIPDIMWGQLIRLERKLASQLGRQEFSIFRSANWTDEKNVLVVLIELENVVIQKIHKVIGPEVILKPHSDNFLKAHKKKAAGPRIEEGRLVVEAERKYWNAKEFLKVYLKKVKKEAKAGLRASMNKGYKVIGEKEMIELYKKNKDFQQFFTFYLKGKEEFLNF